MPANKFHAPVLSPLHPFESESPGLFTPDGAEGFPAGTVDGAIVFPLPPWTPPLPCPPPPLEGESDMTKVGLGSTFSELLTLELDQVEGAAGATVEE
jgi:hypothetical protein